MDQHAPAHHDRMVDEKEAASFLGCKPNTLSKARVYGGPFAVRYCKIGRRVTYSMRDLVQHVRTRTIDNTSQSAIG